MSIYSVMQTPIKVLPKNHPKASSESSNIGSVVDRKIVCQQGGQTIYGGGLLPRLTLLGRWEEWQ